MLLLWERSGRHIVTLRDHNLVWKPFRNGMVDRLSLLRAQNNYAGRKKKKEKIRVSGEL